MAKKQTRPISKSKLMLGIQCHKNLWLALNSKELATGVDAATQFQFDEGNEVGALAREHFGKGQIIETAYWDYEKAHQLTEKAIQDKVTTIFEAAFLHKNTYARADILHKDAKGWHLIEVKKSTSVKDYHIADSAIQTYIIESTGIKLKSISIMYINNKVIYPDLKKLFVTEDITDLVRDALKDIPAKIEKLKKIAESKAEPKVKIGPHCDDPFTCGFKDYCWKNVPKYPVFDLPNLSTDKKWDLFNSGVESIKDLNAQDYKNNIARAIEVVKSKKTFIDKKSIQTELKMAMAPLLF
jgi:CRISPR/Cas system-associated exonuclease Cas4 (RecB family)